MKLTKTRIKDVLYSAVANETPQVLSDVLVQNKNGQQPLDVALPSPSPKGTPRPKVIQLAIAAAAALVLAVALYIGLAPALRVDSIVSFDVNPSIQLTLNRREQVIKATAMNPDAEIILDDMNLSRVDLPVAVNALMGSMLKHGYISSTSNTVLISVENPDAKRATALQERLASDVDGILQLSSVDAAVVSQTLSNDQRLQQLATTHGISLGKASLIDTLVKQNPLLNFSDVASLSVNDICLLMAGKQNGQSHVRTHGNPSSAAYIGELAALQMAFNHAGVAEQTVLAATAELDMDDGRMTYEVDFTTAAGKYEYDIDATNGAVLTFEQDITPGAVLPPAPPSAPPSAPPPASAPASPATGGSVTMDEAKTIAMERAGTDPTTVTFEKESMYDRHGISVYGFIFLANSQRYSCIIDASTGNILVFYTHIINDYDWRGRGSHGGGWHSGGNAAPNNFITEEQAKAIAFEHAGTTAASVQKLQVKLKQDNARMVYEVDFNMGKLEYEYDIDAVTGEILDWDIDD